MYGLSTEYFEHLRSPAWRAIRRKLIEVTGDFCHECGVNGPSRMPDQPTLDAHHLTYRRFGREDLDDLILLCRPCHEREHMRRMARYLSEGSAFRTPEGACWRDVSEALLSEYGDLIDILGEV